MPFSSAILSSKNGLKIRGVGVAASFIKGQFEEEFILKISTCKEG